jgi:hypothetical protein
MLPLENFIFTLHAHARMASTGYHDTESRPSGAPIPISYGDQLQWTWFQAIRSAIKANMMWQDDSGIPKKLIGRGKYTLSNPISLDLLEF